MERVGRERRPEEATQWGDRASWLRGRRKGVIWQDNPKRRCKGNPTWRQQWGQPHCETMHRRVAIPDRNAAPHLSIMGALLQGHHDNTHITFFSGLVLPTPCCGDDPNKHFVCLHGQALFCRHAAHTGARATRERRAKAVDVNSGPRHPEAHLFFRSLRGEDNPSDAHIAQHMAT